MTNEFYRCKCYRCAYVWFIRPTLYTKKCPHCQGVNIRICVVKKTPPKNRGKSCA